MKGSSPFLKKRTKRLFSIRSATASQMFFASFFQKRSSSFCLFLLVLVGCADVRTTPAANGLIPYAPLKAGFNSGNSGKPNFGKMLTLPDRSVVSDQGSFGYSTDIVFDVSTGVLTRLSVSPKMPFGSMDGARIDSQSVTLSIAQRNALVAQANLAWAPDRPFSGPRSPMDVFRSVWLIDGMRVKAIDGFGAGAAIVQAIDAAARETGLYPRPVGSPGER